MRIKPRHRNVDIAGAIYLPYLSEWHSHCNLAELVTLISSAFSEDPPVFAVPPSSSSSSSSNHNSSSHPPPPQPSQESPPVYNSNPNPNPVSLPPPVYKSSSYSNNDKIQHKDKAGVEYKHGDTGMDRAAVKASLVKEISTRLTRQLTISGQQSQATLDSLMGLQSKLQTGSEELKQARQNLELEENALRTAVAGLEQQEEELKAWLEQHEGKHEAEVDANDALYCKDSWSKQMFELGTSLSLFTFYK